MKRALVLSLFATAMIGLAAFAGPSLNPWFEVNVPEIAGGVVPAPTLDAGLTIEGMLSNAWFIDLGFTYEDADLLDGGNDIGLGFESNIGFDQVAAVNQTGSLSYGCEFTFGCDVIYEMRYPNRLVIDEFIPGFMAAGYVGPLKIWAGLDLPWNGADAWLFRPSFGMRVDFDIEL